MTNYSEEFIEHCSKGDLEKAKHMLFVQYDRQNINISKWNDEAFRDACRFGHLEVAKWLLEVEPSIDISAQDEYAFRRACCNNHIDVATWLQSLHPEKYEFEIINNDTIFGFVYKMEMRFCHMCEKGKLEEAKKFLQDNPTLDISYDNESAFQCAVYQGHFELAKWLLEVKPDINISAKDDYAFRLAVMDGHLEIAKWLLQLKPDIDISVKNEFAFRHACQNGKLETAKWILEINPKTNVFAENDYAFRVASTDVVFNGGDTAVARWLQSLYPERYSLEFEDDKIVSCKVTQVCYSKYSKHYNEN